MKSITSYLSIICLIFALSIGFGCDNAQKRSSTEGEELAAKRVHISIGTAPTGGAFFVVGSAIAAVVGDNTSETGWEVTAESTKGTQENIRRLVNSELEFALANAAISYFAVRGEGAWKTEHPIRTVMTLAPMSVCSLRRNLQVSVASKILQENELSLDQQGQALSTSLNRYSLHTVSPMKIFHRSTVLTPARWIF